MSTYRERRERKAARYREWAGKREVTATAALNSYPETRHDWAFITQPGRIPFRERMNRADERAHASLDKAESMRSRADGIEDQLAGAIYEDDPDAIEQLQARITRLEAERARIKAYNKSVRAGAPDVSLLDEKQRRDLATHLRFSGPYADRKGPVFPSYGLSNLAGNINRQKQRLGRLQRAAASAAAIIEVEGEGGEQGEQG